MSWQSVRGAVGLTAHAADTLDGTPMYRLYNPNSGEHFYTADSNERTVLDNVGWNYEGYGFVASYAPIGTIGASAEGQAVYRLYNPNAGDHHYTKDVNEKNFLVSVGWNDEGIGWYTPTVTTTCTQDVYRLYNPNATGAGSHHYTTSAGEAQYLASVGWDYEGVSWLSAHDVETTNVVEATCVSEGYTGDATCKSCGKSKAGSTTAINNNHSATYTEATYETHAVGCRCGLCNEIIWWSDEERVATY